MEFFSPSSSSFIASCFVRHRPLYEGAEAADRLHSSTVRYRWPNERRCSVRRRRRRRRRRRPSHRVRRNQIAPFPLQETHSGAELEEMKEDG